MADKLKSSMLDSIDDEKLSKPTPNRLAEGYCATVISNLEGWRGGVLPCTRESRQPTIEHLDLRVRRLENIDDINSPPPMDTPSWESLTWRVARLHRTMPPGPQILSYWMTASSPPLMSATVSLLQSTVASIGGWGLRSWATFVEGEPDLAGDDFVQAAAQFLCYLAGRRRYKVQGCFDLAPNCRLALDLSLDADANPGFYVPGPTLRTGPGANMISRVAGRCTCTCHYGGLPAPGPPPPPPPGAVKVHNPRRKQKRRHVGVKARIARVFGKLAFWKRNRDEDIDSDSDASSISTSSSSSTAV